MGDNRYDSEDRKVFVGGLAQEATQDDLESYFGKYGGLERVQLKMDSQTGRSRGFAFIVFQDVAAMEAALAEEHEIKGKRTTVKKADVKPSKIYVGRLPFDLSNDDIRNYFAGHGTVTEFIRPIDKMKDNAPKHFAFISFENEAVSKKLIQMGTVTINHCAGIIVTEVNPNPRDGGAGRGRGRGGYGGRYGGVQQHSFRF